MRTNLIPFPPLLRSFKMDFQNTPQEKSLAGLKFAPAKPE